MIIGLMVALFIGSIIIFINRKKYSSSYMVLGGLIGASITLLSRVFSLSLINGEWEGITPLEGLMGIFFTVIGALIVWASIPLIKHDLKEERIPLYYAMVLMLITSLCGMVFFDHLIVVFIFVEISAFLAAGIVMIKESEENFKAGFKYLVLSLFASAFLITGIVILYRLTGTLDINFIKMKLIALSDLTLIRYSFIFIMIGIFFKSALFPFHFWLPDAHGSAPSPSSALLSALVLKGYIVLFIKLIYIAYGISIVRLLNILPIVLILGVSAMMYGSILAIMQRKLKNMIAYSSVAQIGYIYMGIGLGTPLGLAAAIFHIITHGITKACLFLCAGQIIDKTGHKKIRQLDSVGKKLPITMALFTICGWSMIGIPLLIGFSSKWNFATAILDNGSYWVILALSISSLLNAVYYLPVSIRAYFTVDSKDENPNVESEKDLIPIIILGVAVILFGIFSSPVINLINNIVEKL